MDWQTFWQNLRNQALDAQQGDSLLEQLASFDQPLDAFWYPGSGDDLTPLMLDVPNNPAGRRLLRLNGKPQSNPVLFWMNDYSEDYQHFPGDDLLGRHWKSCYPELWEEYQARAVFGRQRERYRLNQDIVITLFTVTVYNQDQGAHDRDAGGERRMRVDRPSGEHHLHRKRLAAGPDEPRRASRAGNHAEVHLGLPEQGVRSGNDEIARERELAPAAQRVSAHGGDQRLRKRPDRAPVPCPLVRQHLDRAERRHLADVRPRREVLGTAGDHDGARARIVGRRRELRGDLRERTRAQGVARRRAVDRQQQHAPRGPRDPDVLMGARSRGTRCVVARHRGIVARTVRRRDGVTCA